MRLLDLEPAYRRFVLDRLKRGGFEPQSFHLEIPPEDEMFYRAVLPGFPNRPGAAFYRYVESALRTFHVYEQLANLVGGFTRIERVLDFGSGYGRLTRALVQRLRPDQIWACDIYPHAVGWQAETLGVNGLVSVSDPARFALDQRHEIVFAASVFSHLPDGLFQRWLARLYDLVAPGGILAFSVHDATFAPPGQQLSETGIAYERASESQTLDPSIYGMSYVTPDYVQAAVASACGEAAAVLMTRHPRGLFESQDLYVVPGRDRRPLSLDLDVAPKGGFVARPQEGLWSGWGLDSSVGGQVVQADLFIEDQHVSSISPTANNHDVMKFFPGSPNIAVSWAFPRVAVDPDALLRVDLTTSSGAIGHCYAIGRFAADGTLVRS